MRILLVTFNITTLMMIFGIYVQYGYSAKSRIKHSTLLLTFEDIVILTSNNPFFYFFMLKLCKILAILNMKDKCQFEIVAEIKRLDVMTKIFTVICFINFPVIALTGILKANKVIWIADDLYYVTAAV